MDVHYLTDTSSVNLGKNTKAFKHESEKSVWLNSDWITHFTDKLKENKHLNSVANTMVVLSFLVMISLWFPCTASFNMF